ncbi:hypothetical protein RFN29_27165 [Mesorhizobium sp. VK22B]|uniref:Uncharacterized protein n=1 Tax=Mesorhizobium captivum TaxID=3072319 RepID=A0ABU4Z8D6_9HYPH|nr:MULTISPECIES: hypothetical protein [unclassified Mesorhizobium]MDX8495243.1 hypothetical protein [Mesorhizobium sp. VK22B]
MNPLPIPIPSIKADQDNLPRVEITGLLIEQAATYQFESGTVATF